MLPLLGVVIAAVAGGYTVAVGRAIWKLLADRPWNEMLVAIYPPMILALCILTALVWNPQDARFPAPAFYSTAAQVIPVLMIALVFERHLVSKLSPFLRAEFAIVLILGEVAAFVAAAGSFSNSEAPEDVGGSYVFTGVLASLTATALLASVLVIMVGAVAPRPSVAGDGTAST